MKLSLTRGIGVPGGVALLLGSWRAFAVGTLHAYHSVRVKLVVSWGVSSVGAGARCAYNDAVAMLILPFLAVVGTYTGLRAALFLVPLSTIMITAVLLHHAESLAVVAAPLGDAAARGAPPAGSDTIDVATAVALGAMSVMELVTPIIPLALLPSNTRKLGSAYGSIEAIYIGVQTSIALLLGFARTLADFPGALVLLLLGFSAALLISLPLLSRARDLPTTGRRTASQLNTLCLGTTFGDITPVRGSQLIHDVRGTV